MQNTKKHEKKNQSMEGSGPGTVREYWEPKILDDDAQLFIADLERALSRPNPPDLHWVLRCTVSERAIRCARALIPLLPRPLNIDYCKPGFLWTDTPLQVAVQIQNAPPGLKKEFVRMFLELGANPNVTTTSDGTPIDYLLSLGSQGRADCDYHFELFNLLIDYGGSPYLADPCWVIDPNWKYLCCLWDERRDAIDLRRRAVLTFMLSIQRAYPHVPVDVIRLIAQRYVFSLLGVRHPWKAWLPPPQSK